MSNYTGYGKFVIYQKFCLFKEIFFLSELRNIFVSSFAIYSKICRSVLHSCTYSSERSMNDEKKIFKITNFFLCLPLGRSNNMICNKIYETLVFTGLKNTLIHNKEHKTSIITFNATF